MKSDSVQAWAYANRSYALAKRRQLTFMLPKIFINKSRLLYAQARFEEALRYCHLVQQYARQFGQLAPLAESYRRIAQIRSKQDNSAEAFRAFKTALAIQRRAGDTLGLAKTYSDMGVLYSLQGDYLNAIKNYLLGVKFSEQHTNSTYARVRIRAFRNLSALYSQNNDSINDLYYMRQAYHLLRQYPDPLVEVGLLEDFGVYNIDRRRDSVALRYYLASERQLQKLNPQMQLRESADIYRGLGALAQRRKENKQALVYLRRAAAQYQKVNKTLEYVNALHSIAESHRQLGQYKAASSVANRALALSLKAKYANAVADSYKIISELSASAGDSAAAFRYQVRYLGLHDSLFSQAKAQQMAELNTRYETKRKESEIIWLKNKSIISNYNTKLLKTVRNLLAGGLAAVALLGATAVWRYRRERRARRKLEAKELQLMHTQQRLQQSLEEKDVLLKEVHHRVKNNLQIISSLMALQSNKQRLPQVKQVLRESQSWVYSIALIHEMLYQSENLVHIEMQDFLERLTTSLGTTFAPLQQGVVNCRVRAEQITLNTTTAVPVALIINELVTNAYEHAFQRRHEGNIQVSLVKTADAEVQLTVADDGIGLPAGFSIERSTSLGLRLIKSLTQQLHGSLQVQSTANGTTFAIAFAPLPEVHLPTK